MDPPCFAEHGTKREREACHENPGPSRADIWKSLNRGQFGVEPKDDDRSVGEDAANDDEVV